MKVLVVLLVLLTTTLQTGEAAVRVRIRAYNVIGELDIETITTPQVDSFTLGSRVLLTCDVEGLPVGSEVLSHKWEYNCTASVTGRCEIQEGDLYYRVVNDTLLVDITSVIGQKRYYCEVDYQDEQKTLSYQRMFTPLISVAGSSAAYLSTPTSLLLNHSLITDIAQARGRNGQQWINCTSGREGERTGIYYEVNGNNVPRGRSIMPNQHLTNGLYYCSKRQLIRNYFSLYLQNSTSLPTPNVSVRDTGWTFTSPDGSKVERYIVEFECSVRDITFVEKYMSVSTCEGTGQVSTSVSCFGGLGQLYRVKVWAVNGGNISRQPAVKCLTPDGQCRMEEGAMGTTQGNTAMPPGATTPSGPSSSRTDQAMPPGGNQPATVGNQPGIGTFVGVGVGVGVFLLLALVIMVALLLVVVTVRKKAAYKPRGNKETKDHMYYNDAIVVQQEMEMKGKGLGHDYDDVDKDKAEEGSIVDGFDPYYEYVGSKPQIKSAMKPASKKAPNPLGANNIEDLYAVVDKSKKKGAMKKERDEESAVTGKGDLYSMPMGKMEDEGEGVVASGNVEEREVYDDTVGLRYEPKTDNESGQWSDGERKTPDVNMLYAVVDKSRKMKK